MNQVVRARNQVDHPGYRRLAWDRCPLCDGEFSCSAWDSAPTMRERWKQHLMDPKAHNRSELEADQILTDMAPQ